MKKSVVKHRLDKLKPSVDAGVKHQRLFEVGVRPALMLKVCQYQESQDMTPDETNVQMNGHVYDVTQTDGTVGAELSHVIRKATDILSTVHPDREPLADSWWAMDKRGKCEFSFIDICRRLQNIMFSD